MHDLNVADLDAIDQGRDFDLFAPFRTEEGAKLKALFNPNGMLNPLDTIVYRENIDHLAPPGAATVDLRVDTRAGVILARDMQIGVAYFPQGPVLKGVQDFTAGQSLVFRSIPVKAGAELIIAASAAVEVAVSAFAGGAAPTPALGGVPGSNPLADELRGAVPWVVGGLVGLVVLSALLHRLLP